MHKRCPGEKEPAGGLFERCGPEVSAVREVSRWALAARLHSPGCHQRSSLGPCLASQSSWSACYVPSLLSLALEASTVWPQSLCTATTHTRAGQCPPHPAARCHHHLCHLSPLLLAPALPPASKALHPCYGIGSLGVFRKPCFLTRSDMASIATGLSQPPPLRGPGRFLPELLTPKPFP